MWSSPHTWVAGEVFSASLGNTHIRDNLLWLGGPDSRGSALPAAPPDGTIYNYVADAANGVLWPFKFNTAEATYKWEAAGTPTPLMSSITTDELFAAAPGNGVWADLVTVGPTITTTLSGDFDWHIFAQAYGAAGGFQSVAAKFGAAATVPEDGTGSPAGAAASPLGSARSWMRRTVPVATAVKLQYLASNNNTVARWKQRTLACTPVRCI